MSCCNFSKRILKSYLRLFFQAPRNITKDVGTFDDLICPMPTQIDIMGAWFRDVDGHVQCTLSVAQVDAGYYDDIINKCDGRYQCNNVDVRVGGSMWCPASLFKADTIDSVTIQYRCLQPVSGIVKKNSSLTSKLCLQLNAISASIYHSHFLLVFSTRLFTIDSKNVLAISSVAIWVILHGLLQT